ncbi:hypothetical protein [uncultured Tenacibaculum sp.]|uniref:hypothetical protein n=1 Tax=uncultured Tenacibaculum sp. TaxID=174713 RepID=UPI00261D1A74|nr:hypothetical protein [uncultured Tenacibaculum sp.]
MVHGFDSADDVNVIGLNGWFDGWCPSKGIAERLEGQGRTVAAQKAEWDKKYANLQKGKEALEWSDLKKEVQRLEGIIEKETLNLQKEQGIAEALGLGAWCNGAVARRKRAETFLRNIENGLGQVKGAYQTLENQQTQGIRLAGETIEKHKQAIAELKRKVGVLQQKIIVYKAKRDNEAISNKQSDKNASILGKVTENAPLILGVLAVGGAVYYYTNKKKKTAVKKVVA